jgi:hypothetical protein
MSETQPLYNTLGFEYNQGGFGGFDVMSGFGGGDMGGGFMGNQDGPKSAEKKVTLSLNWNGFLLLFDSRIVINLL